MWFSVRFKLFSLSVSDSSCTMVSNDVTYSEFNQICPLNAATGTNQCGREIGINQCKQECLNDVNCTAIIHYTSPDACVKYSQYTNGSNTGTSFIKSCPPKPCELFPIQLLIPIILTVCTDNFRQAVSLCLSVCLFVSLWVYSCLFSLCLVFLCLRCTWVSVSACVFVSVSLSFCLSGLSDSLP